jgi:hypothetical protein
MSGESGVLSITSGVIKTLVVNALHKVDAVLRVATVSETTVQASQK